MRFPLRVSPRGSARVGTCPIGSPPARAAATCLHTLITFRGAHTRTLLNLGCVARLWRRASPTCRSCITPSRPCPSSMEDRSTQCQPTTTPIQTGPHAEWSQLDLLEPLVQNNCVPGTLEVEHASIPEAQRLSREFFELCDCHRRLRIRVIVPLLYVVGFLSKLFEGQCDPDKRSFLCRRS